MSEHFSAMIKSVPHDTQRYDTVGDWMIKQEPLRLSSGRGPTLWRDPEFVISVSHLQDRRYEFLVAMHELVEAFLCREHGISEEAVTAFDMAFDGEGEPGDDLRSPYREEHLIATTIERMLAAYLQVEWPEYERAIAECGSRQCRKSPIGGTPAAKPSDGSVP